VAKSKPDPTFKIRELKDGSSHQVVMEPQEHAPEILIGDFGSESEAKEWIKNDSRAWLANQAKLRHC
jgi:hypothetical protein